MLHQRVQHPGVALVGGDHQRGLVLVPLIDQAGAVLHQHGDHGGVTLDKVNILESLYPDTDALTLHAAWWRQVIRVELSGMMTNSELE